MSIVDNFPVYTIDLKIKIRFGGNYICTKMRRKMRAK